MKSIFRKSLCLLMILSFVLFGFSFVKINVNADDSDNIVVTKALSEIATTSKWTTSSGSNAYCYKTFNLDENITISTTGNPNCGSFWGTDWRLYQAQNGNVTVSCSASYKIVSVKYTYTVSNSGVLKDGSINIASNTVVSVNAKSKTLTLGNTSTKTNGQVKITQISVTYAIDPIATISFDKNEGTGTDIEAMQVTKGETSESLPECTYTRSGYSFKEWNTQADGNGTSYAVGSTIANVNEDITLFAIWEFNSGNNVLVTFNSNTGEGSTTSTQGVEINTPTALNSNTFTNGGKAFSGWNTEVNGSGTSYADGATVTLTAALTLYAQWTNYSIAQVLENGVLGNTYTVKGEITAICKTTDAYIQDSTGAILIYDYQSITGNANFVTGNTVSFTATLATYNDLYQLKSLTNISVISDDTTVNIAALNSASDITVANNRKYIELNEVKLNTVSSKTATVDGADYSIYYDGADYVDGEEYLLAGNYVNIKGVISTTATTKKICVTSVTSCTQYSLVFNMDGGKAISPQYVLAGNKFSAPTTTPTKDDDATYTYEFAGWYADSTYNTLFDFNQVYTEDKVAYAKWTATEFSAIQQNLNTINAYMSLAYTYDFTSQATYKYVKVTDISMLKAGDKVLFTCDAQKAYCTGFNSTYLTTAKYTGTPEYTNEYVFTLGGTEGAWTFTSTDGTLGATSDYKLNVSGNETTTWTISISSGVATIGSTAGGEMKYNSTSPRFKTYASGQQSINLYKQVADKVINSSDFRIRCGIDKAISSVVSSYAGAVYGIEVSDGTNTRKYASTNSLYNTDDENCDYVIIDLGDCLTNTTRLTQTFTVRAYVTYDSTTYYSTETKTFSVLGLLNTYYNNDATKALVKDLRVLLIEMGIIE